MQRWNRIQIFRPIFTAFCLHFAVLLGPGEKLAKGRSLYSSKLTCKLTLQQNGELLLSRVCDNSEVWSVRSGVGSTVNLGFGSDRLIKEVIMNANGKLDFIEQSGKRFLGSLLDSGPDAAGADLRLRDDCRMCIFKDGSCRWTAHARTQLECPAEWRDHQHIFVAVTIGEPLFPIKTFL